MTKRDKKICCLPGCYHKAAIDLGVLWNLSPVSYQYYCALHSIDIIDLLHEMFKKRDTKKKLEKHFSEEEKKLKPVLDKRLSH